MATPPGYAHEQYSGQGNADLIPLCVGILWSLLADGSTPFLCRLKSEVKLLTLLLTSIRCVQHIHLFIGIISASVLGCWQDVVMIHVKHAWS